MKITKKWPSPQPWLKNWILPPDLLETTFWAQEAWCGKEQCPGNAWHVYEWRLHPAKIAFMVMEALNCSMSSPLARNAHSSTANVLILNCYPLGTLYWMKSKDRFMAVCEGWKVNAERWTSSAGMGATEGFAIHKKTGKDDSRELNLPVNSVKPALIKPILVVLTRCCWCCLNEDMAFCVLHWRDILITVLFKAWNMVLKA